MLALAISGSDAAIRKLIMAGADPMIMTKEGASALDQAKQSSQSTFDYLECVMRGICHAHEQHGSIAASTSVRKSAFLILAPIVLYNSRQNRCQCSRFVGSSESSAGRGCGEPAAHLEASQKAVQGAFTRCKE
jgi:hypothetical protein